MGEGGRRRSSIMRITSHTELDVYQRAFAAAMELFHDTLSFPVEERYSLTDQCRRSSRSVCANITEAWRKRRYPASFVAKLSDAEGEAAETQTWLKFATECGYMSHGRSESLNREYDAILGMLVRMISNPDSWVLPNSSK